MNTSHNYRFIERDYWYKKASSGGNLPPSQIDDMLDRTDLPYCDLTFKFFDDGSLLIVDNDTNQHLQPRDLTGAAFDFYVRKRIEQIRSNLLEKQLQYA
ncbi:hypothetical protein [Paenibacillus athensensis]|uniref:Uncharacterized protein n=1 Tax=Paenibacillus athensensis TaxID=1967502 RepID=A0A4Y8QAI1_9BACL|nr:hypothetical protein [Paenibacillus athensensis]